MKHAILLFVFSLMLIKASAQQSLTDIRRKSWSVLVFKIPADTAQTYLTEGIQSIEQYLKAPAFAEFPADSLTSVQLPTGNYLIISVQDTIIEAEYVGVSALKPVILNNQVKPHILLRDSSGTIIKKAQIWVNGKKTSFQPSSGIFEVRQKNPDEELIRIEAPEDTSFALFSLLLKNYKSPWQQRLTRIRSTKTGRIIIWLPLKIRHLVKTPVRKWFYKRYYYKRNTEKGYFIFNKPKYLPRDTIKFKAYVLNKKNKRYKRQVTVVLQYSRNQQYYTREITRLNRESPGSFVYEFQANDSLPNDNDIQISLQNKKRKVLLTSYFRIEDYLLSEVATYNLRSQKSDFSSSDTMHFFANAKDANGLTIMDGKVKLILVTNAVKEFHQEMVYVPDTLWQQEKTLETDNETRFQIPGSLLPKADLEIRAIAIFRNSNNETQQKEETVTFTGKTSFIHLTEENGFLKAAFMENGMSVPRKAWMTNNISEHPFMIELPYTIKIDPLVSIYEVWTTNENQVRVEYNSLNLDKYYRLKFRRIQIRDSVGFALSNPNGTPVYFSIFDKDKKIQESVSADNTIVWTGKIPQNKAYYLRWHYYWAGEEQHGEETLAYLSKVLETEITGSATVYPGQTDTIKIKVTDYKEKPAKKVNLTAVSYNTQFGGESRVAEPPYIQKFKGKAPLLYNQFETEEAYVSQSFQLSKNQEWRNKFQLDTMPYYQFLYPKNAYHIVKTSIKDIIPQVSVVAVENGVPQEIYMLYINRRLVYFNGCTDKSAYAFDELPGYTKISMRLKERFVEYDSIYLQPFYKHDIAFNLSLPDSNKSITPTQKYWSENEKIILNNSLLLIENNQLNNQGYVWQENKQFKLNSEGLHITGPFKKLDSIQFFKPETFDLKFSFEPGYYYRISPKMVRLRQAGYLKPTIKIFLENKRSRWNLGDTIASLPVISYKEMKPLLLEPSNKFVINVVNESAVKIVIPKDSLFLYTVIQNNDNKENYRILWGGVSFIDQIPKGQYTIVLITNHFRYLQFPLLTIDKKGTYCIQNNHPVYAVENQIISELATKQERIRNNNTESGIQKTEQELKIKESFTNLELEMPSGHNVVLGKVLDAKGKNGIIDCFITIKGYKKSTVSDKNGNFILSDLPAGNYILIFSAFGYKGMEMRVTVQETSIVPITADLELSTAALNEVVVIGYGTQKKKSLTGAVVTIKNENLSEILQGKVAGVSIIPGSGIPGSSETIRIRGASSLSNSSSPLYVVDGIAYETMPNINPDDVKATSVLSISSAVSIYGSRAANGVVVITTKHLTPKMIRTQFRDYALWKPNLKTDKKGEVQFQVTYPDNITSWETFIIGMDKKNRITKTSKIIKSFKPFLAQLSTPQFLLEGDAVTLIGKKTNYTSADIPVKIEFSGIPTYQFSKEEIIHSNEATISEINIKAPAGSDSLHLIFTGISATGFSDGETRSIPVLKRGTTETSGRFVILQRDTLFDFHAGNHTESVTITAINNTIDLLLEEIEQLKNYPYFCMEQTASKLTGFAMEKKIRKSLGQEFKNDNEFVKLKSKLLKSQLFEGGWSWWEKGQANISITNYITRALIEIRPDPSIEPAIRNALLFIQNQLPGLNQFDLLESLYTLSVAQHDLDYAFYLSKIPFDSVSVHQQWRYILILQKQKLNYDKELTTLLSKKIESVTGGMSWGEDGFWWNRNKTATTVAAFRFFSATQGFENEQQKIIQYFLESRKTGYWKNTVESASIVSTILPYLLKENKNFTQSSQLKITGDTSFIINKFPFICSSTRKLKEISISKTGGGITYFTAWQKIFNPEPSVVDSNFRIQTYFEKNNVVLSKLKAGEKTKMIVVVEVKKDAEFIQLDISVPAGCTYGTKTTDMWYEHREYFKDRVLIFVEKLIKGIYKYEIELEPRYTGVFSLNPAKAELMYFPTIYGRNKIEKTEIEK